MRLLALAALLLLSGISAAQQPVAVIDLPRISAKSTTGFTSVLNVVELPDGKIAVNDASSRRLVLLDRNLSSPKVLLDSTLTTSSYGNRSVSVLLCNCDEVWFPDGNSRSILSFDQSGSQNRVMAAPRAADFGLISSGRTVGDTLGHLFYRGAAPLTTAAGAPSPTDARLDSTPLLRANFETRRVDTIAKLRSLRGRTQYWVGAEGKEVMHISVDILGAIDEWTAGANGVVAIVRGHDYHVDWLLPDGQIESSPKLPFDFKRVSNSDKAFLMDSARKAEIAVRRASYEKTRAAGGYPGPDGSRIQLGAFDEPIVDSVPLERMPDYYPPIRAGAVMSDLEGNVWILPTTSAQSRAGELVYDVVNRARGLVARVRLPVGRSIAGFGRNGNVYLMSREANAQWFVERTTLPVKM